MSSKKIYTYLIIKKKVVTPIDPLNPREPWATPVLHDIKLVIKWISCNPV